MAISVGYKLYFHDYSMYILSCSDFSEARLVIVGGNIDVY